MSSLVGILSFVGAVSCKEKANLHFAIMLANSSIWRDSMMSHCFNTQQYDSFCKKAIPCIPDESNGCARIGELFLEELLEDDELSCRLFPLDSESKQCSVLFHFDEVAGMVDSWGLNHFLEFWRAFPVRCLHLGVQVNFTFMFSSKEEEVREVYFDKEYKARRFSPTDVKHLILEMFGKRSIINLLNVSEDTATEILRLTAGVPRLVDKCRSLVNDTNISSAAIEQALKSDIAHVHAYFRQLKAESLANILGFLLFLAESKVPIPHEHVSLSEPKLEECLNRNGYSILNVNLDEYEQNERLITVAKRFCFYVDRANVEPGYVVLVFPEVVLQHIHTNDTTVSGFLKYVTDYRRGNLQPHQFEVLVPVAIWVRFAMLGEGAKRTYGDMIPAFKDTSLGRQRAECFKLCRTFKFTSPKFEETAKARKGNQKRSLSNNDVKGQWLDIVSKSLNIEELIAIAGGNKGADDNLRKSLLSTDKPTFHRMLAPGEYYHPDPQSHGADGYQCLRPLDDEEGHDLTYQYKHLLNSSFTESVLYEEVQAALPEEVMKLNRFFTFILVTSKDGFQLKPRRPTNTLVNEKRVVWKPFSEIVKVTGKKKDDRREHCLKLPRNVEVIVITSQGTVDILGPQSFIRKRQSTSSC